MAYSDQVEFARGIVHAHLGTIPWVPFAAGVTVRVKEIIVSHVAGSTTHSLSVNNADESIHYGHFGIENKQVIYPPIFNGVLFRDGLSFDLGAASADVTVTVIYYTD